MSVTTRRIPIAQTASDKRRTPAPALVDDNTLDTGNNGGANGLSLRFQLAIPRGARIRSAYVVGIAANSLAAAGCNVKINGDHQASSPIIASIADWDGRVRTAAFTMWSPQAFTAGTWYATPDIAPILQEIVDQAGWVTQSFLTIFIEDNASTAGSYRQWSSLNSGAANAPYLMISFDAGEVQTRVRFRSPEPPHEALIEVMPAALRYGFKIRQAQTASFLMSRADPNITAFRDLMLPNRPAMVTIERSDGNLPWVGFVSKFDADAKDPYVSFILADHAWRMKAARCRKTGTYKTSSGRLITDTYREAEGRGEPAMYLKVNQIPAGPGASYEFKADSFLTFLEEMANQTKWEWGLQYDVDEKHVDAFLTWDARRGTDQRDQEAWEEGKHFESVSYHMDYAAAIDSAVVVGGSGAFSSRAAVAVNRSGRASDGISAQKRVGARPPSLGGTRVEVRPQVTDPTVLFQRAQAMHDQPDRIPEQIPFSIVENQVDMDRLAIGDIRTVRLNTTFLGTPIERVVRVVALGMNSVTGVHEVETQVLTDA